jgi:hypothetical protein
MRPGVFIRTSLKQRVYDHFLPKNDARCKVRPSLGLSQALALAPVLNNGPTISAFPKDDARLNEVNTLKP